MMRNEPRVDLVSPAELAAYVAKEIPAWAALARKAGVQPQ